jgi:hypothetical protein
MTRIDVDPADLRSMELNTIGGLIGIGFDVGTTSNPNEQMSSAICVGYDVSEGWIDLDHGQLAA